MESTKRNLFGVRLNHDQLKQDLTEMSREQLDFQKQKWNFDFETLKPLTTTTNNNNFDWKKLNAENPVNYIQAEIVITTLDEFCSEDEEEEVVEDKNDKALLVPAFYKLQRVQKMKESAKLCIKKFIQLATTCAAKPPKPKNKKPTTTTSKKNKSINTQLIITFSENRKDTLRSSRNNSETNLKQPTILSSFQLRKKKNNKQQAQIQTDTINNNNKKD